MFVYCDVDCSAGHGGAAIIPASAAAAVAPGWGGHWGAWGHGHGW